MGYVQAKQTFHARVDGKRVRIKKGQIRPSDDALVERAPHLFGSLKSANSDPVASGAVEDATAEPGRKRRRTSPAKKAAQSTPVVVDQPAEAPPAEVKSDAENDKAGEPTGDEGTPEEAGKAVEPAQEPKPPSQPKRTK